MDYLSLKIKSKLVLAFLAIVPTITHLPLVCSQHASWEHVEKELLVLFEEFMDMDNRESFGQFIDKFTRVLEKNSHTLIPLIPDTAAKNKRQYVANFLRELKKLRNCKDMFVISRVLKTYEQFIPISKINRSQASVISMVSYRITLPDTVQ